MLVQLFTGKHPFVDIPHDAAVMLQVMSGGRPERSMDPSWPEYLWELVELCWSHNPLERPSMSQVVNMMKAANPNLVEVVTVRVLFINLYLKISWLTRGFITGITYGSIRLGYVAA